MVGDILQPTHLLFILVIALVVLGPKRLPEVGKSLGKGLRDFRMAVSGDEAQPAPAVQQTVETPAPTPSAAPAATPAEPVEHTS
jgi:sec-independent protein translocase protein TatA